MLSHFDFERLNVKQFFISDDFIHDDRICLSRIKMHRMMRLILYNISDTQYFIQCRKFVWQVTLIKLNKRSDKKSGIKILKQILFHIVICPNVSNYTRVSYTFE